MKVLLSGSSKRTLAQVWNGNEMQKRGWWRFPHFAYSLKNRNGMLEVADVENWDHKLDVGIMPYTVHV